MNQKRGHGHEDIPNGIPHGEEKDSHMDKMERKSKWTRGRGHSHEHQERGNLDDKEVTAVSCRIQMKASGKQVFLIFGLIIHFMATTTKAKRCIFITRTPKCPGYRSILNKSRRYRLFSALLRSQFGPI